MGRAAAKDQPRPALSAQLRSGPRKRWRPCAGHREKNSGFSQVILFKNVPLRAHGSRPSQIVCSRCPATGALYATPTQREPESSPLPQNNLKTARALQFLSHKPLDYTVELELLGIQGEASEAEQACRVHVEFEFASSCTER